MANRTKSYIEFGKTWQFSISPFMENLFWLHWKVVSKVVYEQPRL